MGTVTAHLDDDVATAPRLHLAWWFVPYTIVSIVHVILLATPLDLAAELTKLLLMPALAIAVLATRPPRGRAVLLLLAAIVLSWLGDGAGTLFAALPTVPMMLAFFGLAHVAYIALFAGHLSHRRLPRWWATIFVWWATMLVVLAAPLLDMPGGAWWIGALGAYGLLLGATTAQGLRCGPVVAIGAVFFLASDTVLAFRLFTPDAMPDWTSPLVMATYTLGQGLIAYGAVRTLHTRAARHLAPDTTEHPEPTR